MKQNQQCWVSVYNKLLSIGKLIKGDQLDKAQGELDELLDKGIFPAGLLNDQEKAYAYNNLAYIYYQREEYKNAIEVYKDILSLSLEPGSKDRYSALTTLAQLYILEKQIEQAELLAEQSIARCWGRTLHRARRRYQGYIFGEWVID